MGGLLVVFASGAGEGGVSPVFVALPVFTMFHIRGVLRPQMWSRTDVDSYSHAIGKVLLALTIQIRSQLQRTVATIEA